MLISNLIDEKPFNSDAQPIQSGLNGLELRSDGMNIVQFDIRIAGKSMEDGSTFLNPRTSGRSRKKDGLVAIFSQKSRNRDKGIEMARRWR
jgi:hypothetical protein